MKTVFVRLYFLIISSLTMVAVAACGSNSSQPEATRLPTLTSIPIAEIQSTQPPRMATSVATNSAATPTVDPALIERGKGRYTALECNTCHGDNGEGTSKGIALAGTSLSEDEFTSFLRSGGTVGVSHQYATNRLSISGASALYQYVKSLTGAGQ